MAQEAINLNLDQSESGGDPEQRRTSSRERKPTEKGLEWQINQTRQSFRSAISSWRSHANKISILLSDSSDIANIRTERYHFEGLMTDISTAYNRLKDLIDIESEAPDFMQQYYGIENENHKIMQNISDYLRVAETESLDSKSHVTARSHRSRASHTSMKSNASKRSDTAIEAAALKAKLKYIDIEAKTRAELEKVETMRQLDVARAKLEVIDSMGPFPGITQSNLDTLPQDGMNDLLNKYVETWSVPTTQQKPVVTQASFPSVPPVHVSATEQKPVVTPVSFPSVPPVHVSVSEQTPVLGPASYPLLSHPVSASNTDTVTQSANVQTGASTIRISQPTVSEPANTFNSANQGLVDLAKSLADQVSLNRLPSPEPNIFYGDPIEYPAWKAAFKTLIDQRQLPSNERIYYLKRYLGGPVKQVVGNYFLLSSDDAYDDAKRLLDERYGDPFVIASAFRNKLDAWSRINSRDPQSLLKFSDFLKQCLTAMQTIPSLNILNDNRENRKMLSKLPEWLVNRWNRMVAQRKEQSGEFPPFKNFVEFISKEAKIACDPVTSPQSLKGLNSVDNDRSTKFLQNQVGKGSQGSRSFLAEVGEDSNSRSSGTINKAVCSLCEKNHELDSCKLFLSKPLLDRKAFIKDKGLCFGCLQGGHISKRCRARKKCKVCSKYHSSSLHGDVKGQPTRHQSSNGTATTSHYNDVSLSDTEQSVQTGVAFLGDTGGASKCSMVVPVYVSHCDNPEKEVLVYALLDTQSDTTFVLEDTRKALGLMGVSVKLSLSTMYAENRVVESQKVKGLMVRGFSDSLRISLPDTYTRNIMPANRAHIPTSEIARLWPHSEPIADYLVPLNPCQIGLLIGYNCPRALIPCEVISPVGDGPFGQRTDLGWGIVGVVDPCHIDNDPICVSHRIITREVPSLLTAGEGEPANRVLFSLKTTVKEVVASDVLRLMEHEFCDPAINSAAYSQEDQRFLTLLDQGIRFKNGHYEMPLPFRNGNPWLPNNKSIALRRLQSLKKRFEKDEKFCQQYLEFMQNLMKNGHAERVPERMSSDGHTWYIPHHGVYHPQKPDKIRVVFDCSAVFDGESLNSHLLQGPDLTNKLLGVICRFRKEPVAIICDVEQMFYQFNVTEEHRDYLRFLWWDSKDYNKNPVEYRMTVHLFGATSSPGCANFGLKRIAADNETEHGKEVADFVRHDFYVDDGLKSLPNVEEALTLIDKSMAMCHKGGVRLHKFVSNVKEVIEYLDPEDRARDLKDIDLVSDKLPIERALGISWCIESDSFQFRIVLQDRPLTRRGILSTVGSLYDPLGFIAPVVLPGKQILQRMCADQADWDDPLPDALRVKWERWRASLVCLSSLKIQRCVKPEGFGKVVVTELHHFSDASSSGYGQCSYIRLVNNENQVTCSFVMGKSKVIPLRPITIPRLELAAALISVKVASFLDQELDYENLTHIYWTDIKVVLGYISNEARRFHVYVANRVQQIKEHTNLSQWSYVSSGENPADVASRGLHANELTSNCTWLKGPEFLWKQDIPVSVPEAITVEPDDPELKRVHSFSVDTESSRFCSLLKRLEYFSSWHRAKLAVALS